MTQHISPITLALAVLASGILSTTGDRSETTCYQGNEFPSTEVILNDVGGRRIYGFLAKIGWTYASGEVRYHCGGSLISQKFVLSVAHCMEYERPGYKNEPDTVRIAERSYGDILKGEDIAIYRIYSHPLYGHHSMYDDIAIIELSEPSKHRPACIWTGSTLPTTTLFALGHDLENIGHQQLMSVKHVRTFDCNELYSSSRKLPEGVISSQFCAGKSNITEREHCKGFIGGPLLTQLTDNPNDVYLVGITNFGQRCNSHDFPNIYTRLSSYKEWIAETINDK